MAPDAPAVGYIIWGVDHVVYGPVDLPVLVGWIKDERVLADTWLFVERNGCWEQAERVPELKMFFHRRPATRAASAFPTAGVPSDGTLSAGALRHIKVLGCLTDEQLEQFLSFAEVQGVAGGSTVVK